MRAGGYDRPGADGLPFMSFRVVVWLLVAVGVVLYLAFGDLGPTTADADQQEKTATACLKGAGLDVKSDIPSYGGYATPEIVLDVDGREGKNDHRAFVFLFNDTSTAESYFERQKSDAENDPPPEGLKIEQRGPAVLRIFSDAPKAAEIRACVDKAAKPPPDEK